MDQSWKIPDCVQVPSHSQMILPAKDVMVCPLRLCEMNVLIIPSVTNEGTLPTKVWQLMVSTVAMCIIIHCYICDTQLDSAWQ